MVTDLEYTIMAGRAYQSTRDEINRFPGPIGWEEPIDERKVLPSGFEAGYFKRGDEIVISFAGTYDSDLSVDWVENANLGSGNCDRSLQLKQAVDYYLQIKAENPNATITLTGHSLGGGLAALVGVFFGVHAVTFDQAPFAMSARSTSTGEGDLLDYLKNKVYPDAAVEAERVKAVTALEHYLQLRADNGGIPNSNLLNNIRADGEFLSAIPLGVFSTIGTTLPGNVLMHGTYSSPSTDMHSISLLTAFLQNDKFREVTTKLTDLLKMVFDKTLFYHETDTNDVNFLEHLVQHQAGSTGQPADHMLDRFTADLQQIAQESGLTMTNNLTKALIAFAMQAYYENRLDPEQKLFSDVGVSGGIRFDFSDVAGSLTDANGYQNTAGNTKYYQDFLATLPTAEQLYINTELPNLLDWFIQAGTQAMTATAGDKRAFMLGGTGSHTLRAHNFTGNNYIDNLMDMASVSM